jgi:hypothetical protein
MTFKSVSYSIGAGIIISAVFVVSYLTMFDDATSHNFIKVSVRNVSSVPFFLFLISSPI